MTRFLGAAFVAAVLGVGGASLAGSVDAERASAASGTTTDVTTADRATTGGTTTGRAAGEDVRGPCDEAEHRTDPRCTGTATRADDRRGRRGRGDRGSSGSGRSGSNKGPG